jgi:aminoglycoside phosphotransferase family enzyme
VGLLPRYIIERAMIQARWKRATIERHRLEKQWEEEVKEDADRFYASGRKYSL